MAYSKVALSLLLLALTAIVNRVQAVDICEDACVVDTYSAHCAGASCVRGVTPGMEQQLCNRRCLEALGGAPMINCLSASPTFSTRANELAQDVSTDIEGFCLGIGIDVFGNDAPSSGPVETPPPVAEASAPVTIDGEAPVSEEPKEIIASDEAVEPSTPSPSDAVVSASSPEDSTLESEPAPSSEPAIESEAAVPSDAAVSSEAVESEAAVPSEEALSSDDAEESAAAESSFDAAPSASAPAPEEFTPESAPEIEPEEAPPSSVEAFDYDDLDEDAFSLFDSMFL